MERTNSIQLNVNFNFQQLLDAIRHLSPEEKQQINEVLWDEQMGIPTEHQTLVMDRVKKSKQAPGRLLDWDAADN